MGTWNRRIYSIRANRAKALWKSVSIQLSFRDYNSSVRLSPSPNSENEQWCEFCLADFALSTFFNHDIQLQNVWGSCGYCGILLCIWIIIVGPGCILALKLALRIFIITWIVLLPKYNLLIYLIFSHLYRWETKTLFLFIIFEKYYWKRSYFWNQYYIF